MPLAPKSMQDVEQLAFVSDPAAIREQLQRLLVHPLFANSKRYPALLSYAVEQTLLGNAAELKERSIGIEVFGRAPTYDANADPVVRITAGEVRKRLSLYYYDSSHAGELVIELPLGSYVPVFRQSEPVAAEPAIDALETAVISTPPQISPFASAAPSAPAPARSSRFRWLAAGMLIIAGCAAGVLVGTAHPPGAAAGTAFKYRSLLGAVHFELESDHLLPGRAGEEHRHGLDQLFRGSGERSGGTAEALCAASSLRKPGAGRCDYANAHRRSARSAPQSLSRRSRL